MVAHAYIKYSVSETVQNLWGSLARQINNTEEAASSDIFWPFQTCIAVLFPKISNYVFKKSYVHADVSRIVSF